MITNFKNFNLIKESPDTLFYNNKKIGIDNGYGDIPFYCFVNSDHTKVKSIYFGDTGVYHGDMPYEPNASYPGRFWLNAKIISFWVYPNIELFNSIINYIEKEFNIEMFNNGWAIEIVKVNNEIDIIKYDKNKPPRDYYLGDSDDDYEMDIIPLDSYNGSEDVPDEIKELHLMNWQEKEKAKKAGMFNTDFGSTKMGWDQPNNIRYRQTIYQENKKSK